MAEVELIYTTAHCHRVCLRYRGSPDFKRHFSGINCHLQEEVLTDWRFYAFMYAFMTARLVFGAWALRKRMWVGRWIPDSFFPQTLLNEQTGSLQHCHGQACIFYKWAVLGTEEYPLSLKMEHHPAYLILTATYGLLLLSFSSHLLVFLQKCPLWRAEKFKWSLKHSNMWLNVMTFISQDTCVVLLQRWRVKVGISFTYKWQKKRRLLSSNNYFCASAVFMTFAFIPTSNMAL